MTAVVETAVRAVSDAEVLQNSAASLGDLRLIASIEDILREQERIATAFQRLRQLAVVEEFLRANEAAREASERVYLTDTGGWADDESERLHGVAADAWDVVADGWYVMEGSWARRLFVVEEARDAGAEYAGRRRKSAGHVVVQSGPVDWSIGRAA